MSSMVKPAGVNTIWGATGVCTDPGSAKSSTGWVVELPPYQTQNWIDNKQDSFIAHVNQYGIAVWDNVTQYQGGKSYSQGSDGNIYKAILTNTNTDPANTLNSAYWALAFEAYGSVAVVTASLNALIANYINLAGVTNTSNARTNLSVWSKAESDSRYAALNGLASNVFNVATATQPNHAVPLNQFSSLLVQATEAQAGIAAIASNTDVSTGTDNTKIVTALKLNTLYLSKAGNLAGLASAATARSNLGLGSMALESGTSFLRVANNLSDIASPSLARGALGLTSTAIQPETYFARVANNLSDVNAVAARTNLGLTTTATTPLTSIVQTANNLSDVNAGAAIANLGLADTATIPSTNFLRRSNNLSDVANVQAARNNLGLGSLATLGANGVVPGNLNFTVVGNGSVGGCYLPNGVIMNWGYLIAGGGATFSIPYTVGCRVTITHGPGAIGAPSSAPGIATQTLTYFTAYGVGGNSYLAIGI
jgi:hypothetical protein